MKTGVEQSVYAMVLLHFLPSKAVLPADAMSKQLGASLIFFQKTVNKASSCGSHHLRLRCKRRL